MVALVATLAKSVAALPFGDYREFGWGREMGKKALNNHLETKAVCMQL